MLIATMIMIVCYGDKDDNEKELNTIIITKYTNIEKEGDRKKK